MLQDCCMLNDVTLDSWLTGKFTVPGNDRRSIHRLGKRYKWRIELLTLLWEIPSAVSSQLETRRRAAPPGRQACRIASRWWIPQVLGQGGPHSGLWVGRVVVDFSTAEPAEPRTLIEKFGGLWAITPMVMKIIKRFKKTAKLATRSRFWECGSGLWRTRRWWIAKDR